MMTQWKTDPLGTGEIGSVYDEHGNPILQVHPHPKHAGTSRKQPEYRNEMAERLCMFPELILMLETMLTTADPSAKSIRAARAVLAKAKGKE